MIVAGTFFTKGWCYSVDSWLEHFLPAVIGFSGKLIVSTDETEDCLKMFCRIDEKLKRVGWECIHIVSKIESDAKECYKDDAQFIIAKLQQKAFSVAKEINPKYFWSIESDVIVPPNSLKVLIQALEFDDCYYDIGMVTYPNGQFLGGRGTPSSHICEDATEDERKIDPELRKRIEKRKKEMEEFLKKRETAGKEKEEEWQKIQDDVKKSPPKGNIFELQSKGWKKRGWMESAYPAIGRGAILPTDWVGLGCTLLSKKALMLSSFEGYELKGTQDLFLCWKKWHPADIKMCVIPHIVCSHIKRRIDKNGFRTNEIDIHDAYHEMEGECVGHLRWKSRKYINFNE